MADEAPQPAGILSAAAQSITTMWAAVLSSITARIGNAPTAALLGAILSVAVVEFYQESHIRPWLEHHNFVEQRIPTVVQPKLVCNDGSEKVLAQMQTLSGRLHDAEQRIGSRIDDAIARTVRQFDTTVQVTRPPQVPTQKK